MPLQKIGRYEVKSELGRGGMATVFHAYDPRVERDVAIKVLPMALLHDPQFRTRFDREAKTIALLEHPAIVPVYDFGEENGQPFIVMRLMSGGSLAERLKKGEIPPTETSKILSRLAEALDLAHSKNIIHRDIKPGNILFDQYGNAFLSDFGIARMEVAGPSLTGSSILGTPAYMSPEQIQGDKQIDGRSDQYALGVIVFQMLTGQIPFTAETPAKVMMKHILDPVPHISPLKPDLPKSVDAVLEKTLAKNPEDRFPTTKAMAVAFEQALHSQAPKTATGLSSPVKSASETMISKPVTPSTLDRTIQRSATPLPGTAIEPPPIKKRPAWLVPGVIGLVILGVIGIAGIWGIASLLPKLTNQNSANTALPSTSVALSTSAGTPTSLPVTNPATASSQVAVLPSATQESADTPVPEVTAEPQATGTSTPTITPTPMPAVPVSGGADKIALIMNRDIWVANVDGTALEQITTDETNKSNLQWTPDGQGIIYITGKCVMIATLEKTMIKVACFDAAGLLEDFRVSPDGSQVAISLDRELYIVPYDLEQLNKARLRTHLMGMAECEFLAPYKRNAVKKIRWSKDGKQIAVMILGAEEGRHVDLIQILDISRCVENPRKLDEFPAQRFTMKGYNNAPVVPSYDWDGELLFSLNSFIRNDGFGDLYIYNSDRKTAEMVNPVDEKCCYRDSQWSPDGSYLFFAFQDIGQGAESVTTFYFVPFGTLNSGAQLVPLSIPPLTDPREAPQAALRPVSLP